MTTFLEAFGRQLARELYNDLLKITFFTALMRLLEDHSKRQFAAEMARLIKTASGAK